MNPDDAYRILAIDPGTDTLGVALIEVDVRVGDVEVVYAGTWHASKRWDPNSDTAYHYGSRVARMAEHKHALTQLLDAFKPNAVACETPFLSRFPQAFGALAELFSLLQFTVLEYSPTIGFLGVDNRSAKTAVGVKTSKVKKEDVRDAVLNLVNLIASHGVRLETLDEHSIDACAVGYYAAELLTDEWRSIDAQR